MAQYDIDPFGKLLETQRWISQDKLNRQQIAKQNALRDIQQQSAQLGLNQQQRGVDFQNALSANPQQARQQFPLLYREYSTQGQGAMTDIGRFTVLAEQQWDKENPGIPMPASEKMKAMLQIKRAQAGEITGNRQAGANVDLDMKPQITSAVETAKADVDIATGARKKEAAKTGELIAVSNMGLYDSANNAVSQVAKIDDLISQIQHSEAITGFGAEMFKNIERLKAKIGSDVATGKVTDTEILDAMMGSEVFPLIKSLGIGARGMDTPAERKFLRQVMTGQIDLNKNTLLKMAKMRRSVAQRTLSKYNKRVSDGSLDNFFENTGIQKTKLIFDTPPQGLPQSVTEEDIKETMRANNMTRKQVLNRLRGQ